MNAFGRVSRKRGPQITTPKIRRGFRSWFVVTVWNDKRDLEEKSRLFHREVTLIKMRVNASRDDDVCADFMPEIQTFAY